MTDPLKGSPQSAARLAAAKAMVFVTDQETEDVLRGALGDVGVKDAEFARGSVVTATAALAKEASPRLLIVDISGLEDPLARIDELAARCSPEVNVVAIGEVNDISLYRQLKDAGVSEYFFKPIVRDVVKRVCYGILSDGRDIGPASTRNGKLVFVLGVRGGVGATTVAVNTALRLADKDQRWVMLVDLDMETGDAALQLAAAPTNALHEALARPDRVDTLFLERGTLHAGTRLDLLAGLEPFGRGTTLKEEAILVLIDKLLQRYRYVFIDLPAFVAVNLSEALHRPSTCILVSTASLASARELVRWREWIGPNTPDRRTVHLLNMGGADGALPEAEFLRAVGQAPDITIPYDRAIATASNLGASAMQKCATLSRGLAEVVRDLSGEAAEPPQSVFRRIFG